jgi:Ca-activated chloride channel homolog
MISSNRIISLAVGIALVTAACGDSSGPSDPPIASLTVSGVSMNSDAFKANGDFSLGLLATDATGQSILSNRANVTATLTNVQQGIAAYYAPGQSAATYTLTTGSTLAQSPITNPTYAAILLDDSGSMSWNDPQRLRADAAKLFWEAVIPARSTNHVALLDFGAGSTTGFTSTRLLQDWTRDQSELEDKLSMIVNAGGTPLYTSLRETSEWIEATTATATNRVMLLLSDGVPGDGSQRLSAIAAAQAANVTVHTVGLGEAADISSAANANAVATVREIAEQTGGVYSAATNAAALGPIFNTLATVSSQGQLVTAFNISPVPPTGALVSGTVSVTIGGQTQTANWSFIAP